MKKRRQAEIGQFHFRIAGSVREGDREERDVDGVFLRILVVATQCGEAQHGGLV